MIQGQLMVFEGADGVGKTTLTQMVYQHLMHDEYPCDLLAFPGNAPASLGHLIYQVHHSPEAFKLPVIAPTSLQLLHVAAHIDAIERYILPKLQSGITIILDRFWWSTWVYGITGGVNPRALQTMLELESMTWGDIIPTALFLIERESPIERDISQATWTQLRAEYERLADSQSSRHPVYIVSNDTSLESAFNTIMTQVDQVLNK